MKLAHQNKSTMNLLVRLCHHRWAIPVLAELHRAGGASKFITLTHRLDVSKGALANTLSRLIDLCWIERNPGYGHPMRPEYILTREGQRLAPGCARIHALLKRTRTEETLLRKWSLPIALAMHRGSARFTELRGALPAITARALTLALKELQHVGIARRDVHEDASPSVEYQLTPRGRRVAERLTSLSR